MAFVLPARPTALVLEKASAVRLAFKEALEPPCGEHLHCGRIASQVPGPGARSVSKTVKHPVGSRG